MSAPSSALAAAPAAPLPVPVGDDAALSELLGPELSSALEKKGYHRLTDVQRSVLDPALAGRDLRISSQTGSGKTLAIGFVLRDVVAAAPPLRAGAAPAAARPRALVIVPTRELARQVHDELRWLYAPRGVSIAAVTGGASYRDEHRALARGPGIVVGTPGRLQDHLDRGAIDPANVSAVVLDEADRMLDLGFREELEAILGVMPEGHQTHLVSATFAHEVRALADRVQRNPVRVEGTPLGSANTDIEHVLYLVSPRERIDALVNVLLYHGDEQTLIFARTRADVAEITRELELAGFAAGSLSGEMPQQARNRALEAFKRGDIRALVATDVAARGIDVQDIARVVQVDPPTDAETYVHRSGRTGRAGRKGTSAVLVPPPALRRTVALLARARVRHVIQPVPSVEAIRAVQDERWLKELTALSTADEAPVSERIRARVQRLVEAGLSERALTWLLAQREQSEGEPRHLSPVRPQPERLTRERAQYQDRSAGREAPRGFGGARSRVPSSGDRSGEGWVTFQVSFGEAHGADARRLVAMLCRRGQVRGADIGAVRVGRVSSEVEVAAPVAQGFAQLARQHDPRDPRVEIRPLAPGPAPASRKPFPRAPLRGGSEPPKRKHKK